MLSGDPCLFPPQPFHTPNLGERLGRHFPRDATLDVRQRRQRGHLSAMVRSRAEPGLHTPDRQFQLQAMDLEKGPSEQRGLGRRHPFRRCAVRGTTDITLPTCHYQEAGPGHFGRGIRRHGRPGARQVHAVPHVGRDQVVWRLYGQERCRQPSIRVRYPVDAAEREAFAGVERGSGVDMREPCQGGGSGRGEAVDEPTRGGNGKGSPVWTVPETAGSIQQWLG